ncbi:MAG: outer membrane protein [Phycisphaerales bacterium]|nr:outer membrane protein [Phycisphaerales bacterium]
MTKRATTLVSIAAGLALGAGSFCWSQDQQAQQQQPAQPDPSAQQPQGAQGTDQDEQQMHAAMKEWRQQVKQVIQQGGPTAPDKLFLLHTAMESKFDRKVNETAAQKSQNPQVKQIAQRMLQDSQQMQQQLQQAAQQAGVQIPQTDSTGVKDSMIQMYTSLPADQFDQRYIAYVNSCKARDLAAFQAEARIAQVPAVKQFAQQALPTIQQHHQQVQQTATALGVIAPGEAVPAGGQIPGGSSGGGK